MVASRRYALCVNALSHFRVTRSPTNASTASRPKYGRSRPEIAEPIAACPYQEMGRSTRKIRSSRARQWLISAVSAVGVVAVSDLGTSRRPPVVARQGPWSSASSLGWTPEPVAEIERRLAAPSALSHHDVRPMIEPQKPRYDQGVSLNGLAGANPSDCCCLRCSRLPSIRDRSTPRPSKPVGGVHPASRVWIVLFEAVGKSGWYSLLAFIPYVGSLVPLIWTAVELPSHHGRSRWWTLLLLIPGVNLVGYWFYAFTLPRSLSLA